MTTRMLALTVLFLVPAPALAQVAAAADLGLGRLTLEIERLAELSGGAMGVAALHLETGRSVMLNGEEPFPMASTYKVPIAVQLFTLVDLGHVRLDSMLALTPGDIHPGSGVISQLLDDPGVELSLRNLVELMMLISDNSATDVVLRVAGGGAAVTRRLHELGVRGVRVDRPTVGLIADFTGVRGVPEDQDIPLHRYRELAGAVTPEARDSAAAAFDRDPRDTSTPAGMLALLEKVWRGEALSGDSRDLLLDIMTRSTTGMDRIRGMLPPDVSVAHKTGTIGGSTNDVGIITLPDGAGHIAIVTYVKGSSRSVEQRERAIAHVSRAIYDYFVFNP